jgi:hypothetical protein
MSYRMSRLLCVGAALSLFCSNALATPAVDLSGNWKLDVKKSTFGVLPVPVSRTINIIHREPLLKLQITEDTGTEKRSQTLEYTTDGKDCVNKVRGNDFHSTLRWEGSSLVVDTEGVYQGNKFRATDRWSLSQDQKTIVIERSASNDNGETHQKLILEKQ